MARSTLSLGTLFSRAFSTARRRRGLELYITSAHLSCNRNLLTIRVVILLFLASEAAFTMFDICPFTMTSHNTILYKQILAIF